LFGSWAKPPKGPFVPPPMPKPAQASFVPFIPPIEAAPPPRPLPGVTEVEHATPISSVFVSLPDQYPPPPVPAPMIARGTTANPALAKGSIIPTPSPRPAPRTSRAAKGSVPPPLPTKPSFRTARAIQPEDFLDNEATNVDTIPTPHR
jgi:hypothetical protein